MSPKRRIYLSLVFTCTCIFHRGNKTFCQASKQIIKQSTGVNKLEKCFFNLFILIVCRIFLASWRLVET